MASFSGLRYSYIMDYAVDKVEYDLERPLVPVLIASISLPMEPRGC